MPAFVKDEACWAKAKRAAKKAGLTEGTDRYWKFANYWYHKHCKGKRSRKTNSKR